jgi:hypothetical protein
MTASLIRASILRLVDDLAEHRPLTTLTTRDIDRIARRIVAAGKGEVALRVLGEGSASTLQGGRA